jgi:hypothetical protein
MAFQLDSNILLSGRGPNVAGAVQQGLNTRSMFDTLREEREQAPMRKKMLENEQIVAQQVQDENTRKLQQADQGRVIDSIANSYRGVQSLVNTGKFNEAADALEANRAVLVQSGSTDLRDTDAAITALRSGDATAIRQIQLQGEQAIQLSDQRKQAGNTTDSASQRERADLIAAVRPALNDKGQIDEGKLDANSRSAAMALGLIAKSGTVTGGERVATTPGLTETVAQSQERLADASETGNLKAQGRLLPSVKAAVTLAEQQALSRGETFTELNSAKAALPGLKTVVENLKVLSSEATFTLAGRSFNAIAKELGISTKGSTSRAAMTAMVDNQVLPLLKPIFGAAFTAIEGDRLRNAFLDPNSTPDSRVASLNAFQDQMERNIATKQREFDLANVEGLNQQASQQREEASPAQSQDTGVTAAQFRNMSPEQQAQVIQNIQSRGQ